jgi:predicted glutamine amidotransferase
MARLFGYFSNQTDRLRCALAFEGSSLERQPTVRTDGWGIGFYQGSEVLLRRKPTEHRDRLNLADVVSDVRSDCVLAHLRSATVGHRSLENTHPFRYRQWLFAHNGSIPGFETLRDPLFESLPDFLQRSVRGVTDSEILFHLFLAVIHESGRLDDPEVDRKSIAAAVREMTSRLDSVSDKAGQSRATLNLVVTNHNAMVALRRGLPMAWVRRHGIRDCAICRKQPDVTSHEPKRINHDGLKYVLVASEHESTPQGWFEVPTNDAGGLLAIDRGLDVLVAEH